MFRRTRTGGESARVAESGQGAPAAVVRIVLFGDPLAVHVLLGEVRCTQQFGRFRLVDESERFQDAELEIEMLAEVLTSPPERHP
jgi:hypothetical protein